MTEEEQVVILEQGSPEAQKVVKAMASNTAGDVLNLLSEEGPMTATTLGEKLNVPLTSIKYHIENLLEAGLITVVDTRWSEKGRQMKLYGVVEKDIILKPKKKSTTSKLAGKYGVTAGIVALCCAVVPILSRALKPNDVTDNATDTLLTTVSDTNEAVPNLMMTGSPASVSDVPSVFSQIDGVFLVIFLGVMAVIIIKFILALSKTKQA